MTYMSRGMVLGVVAMIVIVASSNYLVQFPINDWLTWGAVIFPLAFLVSDLINRAFGAAKARLVVYAGFPLALIVSAVVATPRIALASGAAFLLGQLLDIYVFDRLRRKPWWQAPFIGSALGSVVDTYAFFMLAFIGTQVPWPTLALGDLLVKFAFALLLLAPFRALMNVVAPASQSGGAMSARR